MDHSDLTPLRRTPELLSVVAPMFDEEETARAFYMRVVSALDGVPFELVVVDDGSRDGTARILEDLAASDDRVRVVMLARNFGHQLALTAGLDHASGDVAVMIDADLQDPPEVIPRMLDAWRAGADVVYAVREQRRGETRFKLATARWFYRLFGHMAQIELRQNTGDFRLLDRRALDALLCMRERGRFLRGLTVWIGFTQTAVLYERDPRYAGDTKYTLGRMLRFSLDAITSFSQVPLQAATLLGFVISAVSFLGLPFVVLARLAGLFVHGVPTILFVSLFLGGIQLITVGIIGEYVGRIYDEVKRRPLYLVRGRLNLPEDRAVQARERERITTW